MFTKKDKKVLTGQAKNGLYYFLMNDESDKPFDLKPIVRKDGSHAFIIETEEGPNHLTIDENYCDETESGKYFYHYAHISMIKNDARVRIYFDEKLHIVRTSAFIEEGGKKITKINPASLNIAPGDYQNLLDILKVIKERHNTKIKNLDLAFTPKFMFIQNLEQLRICQQEIHEINQLKAPLYDCRADYLNQETHVMDEKPKAAKQSEPEPPPVSIAPQRLQTTPIIRKKTKLEIKRERIQIAKRKLDELIGNIQALMDSAASDNNDFNQALEKILQLDFMFIHYIDDLDVHIAFYESQIEELKFLCLLHLHAAVLTNQVSYLDQVYTQGQLYIDSLIHRYMIELVKKLNHGVGSFTQSDKEKFKRVTDLLQFYCDKNELFEGFFAFLGKQLAYNPRNGLMYNFIMRAIHVLDDPKFIQFLIDKNFVKRTDCIGVLNESYISLQQYLLLFSNALGGNYLPLLDAFLPHVQQFFEVTKTHIFENLLMNPEEYVVGTFKFDDGQITRVPQRKLQLAERPTQSTMVTPMQAIDFAQHHHFHLSPEPLQLICQSFFIHDPVLAFNYVSVLLNSKCIYRRTVRSAQAEFLLFTNTDEMECFTSQLLIRDVKTAISYMFYPAPEDAKMGIQLIETAQALLQRISEQAYLNDTRDDNTILLRFISDMGKAKNIEQKFNILLSATMYVLTMPWQSSTFKRYCFFTLKYLEVLAENHKFGVIESTLSMLNDIMEEFHEDALSRNCKQMALNSIQKISSKHPISEGIVQLFR